MLFDVCTGGTTGIAALDEDNKIEFTRYDEFGREMNLKEAFRQMSHVFHGITPGVTKSEKRIKKFMEEQKQKASSKASSAVVNKMVEAQKKLGTAFIPIDKNSSGTTAAVSLLANAKKEEAAEQQQSKKKATFNFKTKTGKKVR